MDGVLEQASEEFKRGYEWANRWGWRERCLAVEADKAKLQEQVLRLTDERAFLVGRLQRLEGEQE